MNCLKCGAEVAEGESFCARCLADMEKYPVPEDSYVMIPKRSDADRRSAARKNSLSAEEKLRLSNRSLRRARIWIFVLSLICAGLAACCIWFLAEQKKPALGQNYSTVSPTSSASGPLPTEK